MKLDLSLETDRDGEWVPLEEAQLWDLKKYPLTGSVLPDDFSRNVDLDLDGFRVQYTDRSG
jgi:hypothetical protein